MSDEFDDSENSGEGIKSLRKQYEQLKQDLAAKDEALSKFLARERQTTVADVLKAKGMNPAAAKFYNAEDVSEDAVGKWIEANADVFGGPAQSQTDSNALNAARVTASSYGSPQIGSSPGAPILGSLEEIHRNVKDLPYEELMKQLGFPDQRSAFGGPATR